MIVHLAPDEKFIPDFIRMTAACDDLRRHHFIIMGPCGQGYTYDEFGWAVSRIRSANGLVRHLPRLIRSEIIVHHGLFDNRVAAFFAIALPLLRKSRWIIWGGDLYAHRPDKANIGLRQRLQLAARRIAISRFSWLITHVRGDVALARRWYGHSGRHIHSIVYPSNTFRGPPPTEPRTAGALSIQVGNSADPSNNHEELLRLLAGLKDQNFSISCPLSYGYGSHAERIESMGREMFGSRFSAMRAFIPPAEYRSHLASVDIALFGHRRQQAMGNIITLLGMGKLVFIRPDIASWPYLSGLGLHLGNLLAPDLDLSLAHRLIAHRTNPRIIADHFSTQRLESQLRQIFSRSPGQPPCSRASEGP